MAMLHGLFIFLEVPVSDTYSDIGMTLRSFKYMEKLTKIEQYPCRTHTRIQHLYPSPCNIALWQLQVLRSANNDRILINDWTLT